jgi:hypothetical protein
MLAASRNLQIILDDIGLPALAAGTAPAAPSVLL